MAASRHTVGLGGAGPGVRPGCGVGVTRGEGCGGQSKFGSGTRRPTGGAFLGAGRGAGRRRPDVAGRKSGPAAAARNTRLDARRPRAGRGVGGWGARGGRGSVDHRGGGRLGRPPIPTARLREGRKAERVGSSGGWPGGLSGGAAAARGPDKGANGSELLGRGRPDRCTSAAARRAWGSGLICGLGLMAEQARGPARGSRPNLEHTPPFAGAQCGAAAGGILDRVWQQATPPKAVQAMGAAAPQRAGGGRARGRGGTDGEWGLAGPQQVNGEQVLS